MGKIIIKKLNIHHVHGVWQYGIDQYDNDEDDADSTIPEDNVHGNAPQVLVQDHFAMSPQIKWTSSVAEIHLDYEPKHQHTFEQHEHTF